MSSPNAAERSDDLPEPWIRQFDDKYGCWFYINPETNPPTTTWTHPLAKDGEAHPEQIEAVQQVHTVYQQAVEQGELPPPYQPETDGQDAQQAQGGRTSSSRPSGNSDSKVLEDNDRGLASLLMGGSSSNSHSSSSGLGGMGLGGAAAGGGLGGMLLGALMSNKNSGRTYYSGSPYSSYGLGAPPFMMGGGRYGMGGGMMGSPFGMGGGMMGGPFGMGGGMMGGGLMGGGMMGGPFGMGGGGMMGGGRHHGGGYGGGFGGGGFGGGYGGHHGHGGFGGGRC